MIAQSNIVCWNSIQNNTWGNEGSYSRSQNLATRQYSLRQRVLMDAVVVHGCFRCQLGCLAKKLLAPARNRSWTICSRSCRWFIREVY